MKHSFQDLQWTQGFISLGPHFFTELNPTPLSSVRMVANSPSVAELLGLSASFATDTQWLNILSGNHIEEPLKPIATVYSGHQFGVWAGQLGDGRAIMLGEVEHRGSFWEIQLKGAGKTPYSRMGDGKAVLRSSIREYLCSEAMASLNIPTTRALALVASPVQVVRETLETAAVVTRVAPSFIRFGHFEHFANQPDISLLKQLADFVITQYYPDSKLSLTPYLHFFGEVLKRSAQLVAQWQAIGFCHGVLNTDNMSILALSMDYGPYGFMDAFDMNHICNHTDTQGRYSFSNQPQVFHWNLVRLAESLVLLIAGDASEESTERAVEELKSYLAVFPEIYQENYQELMRTKLGLVNLSFDQQISDLIKDLITLLHDNRVDYTYFFRQLATWVENPTTKIIEDLMMNRLTWGNWSNRYRKLLDILNKPNSEIAQQMRLVNPKYILRQHLAQVAIDRSQQGDDSEVQKLQSILSIPFDEQPEFEAYASLPPDWAQGLEVSCSS